MSAETFVSHPNADTASYTIPKAVGQFIESVYVEIDNTAGGDTTPVISLISPGGDTFAKRAQPSKIAAGDTGTATWALRLTDEATGATGGGGLEYNVGTYGPLNVGDSVDVEVTGVAPAAPIGGGFYLHESNHDAIPLELNAQSDAQAIPVAAQAVATDNNSNVIGMWLQNIAAGDGTAADAAQALGVWIQSLIAGGNAVGVYAQSVKATGASGQAIGVSAENVTADNAFGFVSTVTGKSDGPGTVSTGINVNAIATGNGDAVGAQLRAAVVGSGTAYAILVTHGLCDLHLPGADPGVSGALWNNGGVVNVSP